MEATNNPISEYLFTTLAYRPNCGNEKSANLIRDKYSAIKYKYIVINQPTKVHWLTFDLDHSDALIFDKVGLPEPNFIVRNRESGFSHITYAVESVCVSDNAKTKPIQYLEAIKRTMTRLLKADEGYNNRITKNPFSNHWITTWLNKSVYSLGELHEYLPYRLDPPNLNNEQHHIDLSQRNCSIFNLTRNWAYKNIYYYKNNRTYREWFDVVMNQTLNFSENVICPVKGSLDINEVLCIARSVCKWVWTKYKSKSKILNLDTSLSASERQRQGAYYTHEKRKSESKNKVEEAINKLEKENLKINFKTVSLKTGISRQHLSRCYSHLFPKYSRKPKTKCSRSFEKVQNTSNRKNVNFALHQVTAINNREDSICNTQEPEIRNRCNKKGSVGCDKTNTKKIDGKYYRDGIKRNIDLYKELSEFIECEYRNKNLQNYCIDGVYLSELIVDQEKDFHKRIKIVKMLRDALETNGQNGRFKSFLYCKQYVIQCSLYLSMRLTQTSQKIAKELFFYFHHLPSLDKHSCPFDECLQLQLIMEIINQKLNEFDSISIGIDLIIAAIENPINSNRLFRWKPYIDIISKRMRKSQK